MPNHFHLLLKQKIENGIRDGISQLLNSYTKYINTKHDRVGPLFQGRYKSVPVVSDDQMIHLVRYILLNPYVDHLVSSPEKYKWSSYAEILPDSGIKSDSASEVVNAEILSELFPRKEQFIKFVMDYADLARTKKDLQNLFFD